MLKMFYTKQGIVWFAVTLYKPAFVKIEQVMLYYGIIVIFASTVYCGPVLALLLLIIVARKKIVLVGKYSCSIIRQSLI